ncbi:MAG: FG-GAP repeat domain-containing protein [Armatimonadota bacterium]
MSRLPTGSLLLPFAVAAVAAALPAISAGTAPKEVRWKKTVLDTEFRAEGASAADINRDDKLDIFAGNVWYEAPDWKRHEIRPPQKFEPATGYSNCFLSFAGDFDRDGWADQLVVGFPGEKSVWFRNPGKSGGEWTEHLVTESACNETPIWADLDGDRKPELVSPFKEERMAFYRPGSTPQSGWQQHLIGGLKEPGCNRFSHGLGVGDVNGDKRPDILCKDGYYEQPADRSAERWKFVPAKLGPDCATMYTYDFDGDGDMDVFSSSAHAIGVWWYEQRQGANGPEFVQHTIDDTFSQSHSVQMVDINGDRQPDFVTGKRWWAHGPNGDVNPNDPAVLYWFEFRRKDGKVEWTRHEIDRDSGVGTQFTAIDMNRDRRPDLVISNKKGVFLFEQQ